MQYQKLISGEIIIEFYNSWLGEETVIVNGKLVSKTSSVWGTNHYFTVMENGHYMRYVLTSKINMMNMQVCLDLSRNGKLIHEDVPVSFSIRGKRSTNNDKKHGLAKLKEYELEEALTYFEKALKINPQDPEVFFHMACAYSVLERTVEGFESLKKAVAHGLQDKESILHHDMLAYLRMNAAFEDFLHSGFREYDEEVVIKGTYKL